MSEEHRARQIMYQALLQVSHRDYGQMVPQWREALHQDPDFFSRTCVYIYGESKIRDQVDVACITLLQAPSTYADYREAGRCMLLGNRVYRDTNVPVAGLPPFRIFRVWDYVRKSDAKVPTMLKSTMTDYLRALEANDAWFDAVVLRNRKAVKAAYKYHHVKPSGRAQAILFNEEPPADSKLAILKQIANEQNPREQARLVIQHHIPYTVAASVLPKMNAAVAIALIDVMSPQEALNSIAWVKQSGILEIAEVREAFEAKVAEATASVATAEHRKSAQTTDEGLHAAVEKAKQKAVDQEKHRIQKATLFMGDASSSMDRYFDVMQQLGSRIMPICDGEFSCVLFSDYAQELKVQGNTLADWQAAFRGQRASGWTSMQAGLDLALRNGFMPEQVIVITDGGENRGRCSGVFGMGAFAESLNLYAQQNSMNPNVIVVGLRDTTGSYGHRFAAMIREKGFTVDEFPPPDGEYDYNLFDQIVAVCGGPPAVTLVQRIMETERPRRIRQ